MRKMKSIVAIVLAIGMIGLTGCGAKDSNDEKKPEASSAQVDDSSQAKADYTLLADGTLTVGCEVGYPPFEDFAEDGTTPMGFDIDIISEVAKRLGVEVNIVNTAWDGIFAGINTNYDVVCSAVTINEERKQTMLFSTPYINNYQAVVLPVGSDLSINSFQDLDGKTVALQKETATDKLLSDYKSTGSIDVEIVANEKIASCFTQLTNGEVDAVAVDSTVADGFVAKSPDKYQIVFKDEKEPEQFGIAMGKENTALQSAINDVLAQMEEDGFIQDTYDYWFGFADN